MKRKLDKKYIFEFLQNSTLAVASTVDKQGRPHAAPIFYVMNKNFDFFFVTPNKTQKSLNLDHNKEIVLTITNEKDRETVQVRGLCHKDDALLQNTLSELANKLDHDLEFVTTLPLLKHTKQSKTVVVVKPSEIRFRRYSDDKLEEEHVKMGE